MTVLEGRISGVNLSLSEITIKVPYHPDYAAKAWDRVLVEIPDGRHLTQQQRRMARALVVEPEIIFADEPTGNLDSVTSEEMMQLMRKVVEEKDQTLVMVTHDDHLAEYADRIIRIKDGKIISITEKSDAERADAEKADAEKEDVEKAKAAAPES